MQNSTIILRNVTRPDREFIFHSWLTSVQRSLWPLNEINQRGFFKSYDEYLQELFLNTNTKAQIACLDDSPGMIIGFAVYSEPFLHWVYVKHDFRSQGVMNLLIKNLDIKTITSLTLPIFAIAKKRKWSISLSSNEQVLNAALK